MREIEKITSRDNRRLVRTRKVRDGKEPSLIFIEGRRLVSEALRSELKIEECFVSENFRDEELLDAVNRKAAAMAILPEKIYDSITDTKKSQGIVLIAERPANSWAALELRLAGASLPIVIFLNEANNPSNLGAIFRTAEAADTAGIIVSRNSADAFSPKALRAAMGAAFRIPVLENADFYKTLQWAGDRNLTATACDIDAEDEYFEADWKLPRLLIFGSEAHGLDRTEIEMANETIRIPMENDVESLNLAVSAGIILFEAKRQNIVTG